MSDTKITTNQSKKIEQTNEHKDLIEREKVLQLIERAIATANTHCDVVVPTRELQATLNGLKADLKKL